MFCWKNLTLQIQLPIPARQGSKYLLSPGTDNGKMSLYCTGEGEALNCLAHNFALVYQVEQQVSIISAVRYLISVSITYQM